MDETGNQTTQDNVTLLQARNEFERWRKNRKKRECIPEELLKLAVKLTQKHSIGKICKILRLGHNKLKKLIASSSISKNTISNTASFIEIPLKEVKEQSFLSKFDSVLEFENPNGFKMRIKSFEQDEEYLKKAMTIFHQVFL